MNRLPAEKRRQILHLLVEGNSIRGTARLVDVSPVTVLRQLELTGTACARFHDEKVRGAKARRVECDEIWSFSYCKKSIGPDCENGPGRCRRCVDVDGNHCDSKLIISYPNSARAFHW